MRWLATILLLLSFSATGTGAAAQSHLAQHAHDAVQAPHGHDASHGGDKAPESHHGAPHCVTCMLLAAPAVPPVDALPAPAPTAPVGALAISASRDEDRWHARRQADRGPPARTAPLSRFI